MRKGLFLWWFPASMLPQNLWGEFMIRTTFGAAILLALAGCNHGLPLNSASSNAGNVQANAQAASLVLYDAAGGGPYWSFNLTNGGNGFTMSHPINTAPFQTTHTGTITSQTQLNGGAWLIEGQAGGQSIVVIIEPVVSGVCSDGHVEGQDTVRVAWGGYLYKGCGKLI